MDSKSDSITNGHRHPETILMEIAQTRRSLTHKIQSLEGEVKHTVEDASSSVQSGIKSVKETFDIRHQIKQHPTYWIGGAFALGMVLGLSDDYGEQIRGEIHAAKGKLVTKLVEGIIDRVSKIQL